MRRSKYLTIASVAVLMFVGVHTADAGWPFDCLFKSEHRFCEPAKPGDILRTVAVRITNNQAMRINPEALRQPLNVRVQATPGANPSLFDTPSQEKRIDEIESALKEMALQLKQISILLENKKDN